MRIAAEGAVGPWDAGLGIEPEQIAIGAVGIEHASGPIGDQCALGQIVDEGLGKIVPPMARSKMQNTDRSGEQTEHSNHRETGENGEHERLGHLAAHQSNADGGHGQGQREKHDQANAPVTLGLVRDGFGVAHGGVNIGHGLGKYPIRLVLTGDCHGCVITR
jgi:hypothetical protein